MARKSIRIPRFVTLRTRLALSFIAIATLLIGLILVVIYFNFINLLHADTKANDILMVERGLRVQFFSFFLLSLPIVGLAAWLIGDRVAKPIKLLANVTAQIAQGDNGYRPEINTKVSEIAQLRTSFYSMADQTQSLISNLEKHVSERTQEIESRSTKLQTAARIIRDASSAKTIDELLDRTARLLRERLSYYHVGIFLIDENQEFAVLRAASGEAGQLMIANNHKLKIGEVGMVGYVTKTGEPRIALDVGADAVHFHNPLLPYTRSEMTLPLEVRGKVIGAVDIQSDKVNAFSEDDITIMQILTDQLSVTVEKEDLIRRLTQNISTVGQLSENYTLRTWESFTQQALAHRGYRYRGVSLEPLEISEDEFEGMLVSSNPKKKTDGENRENAILNVPIRLRDQVIGVLNIKFQEKKISSETKGIIEQAAGRLAIALENARLVQDAQHLAEREKQMNIISAQVQQSTNLETVLQNTIRELGNALGVPNTFIQIGLIRSEDKE